MFTLESTSSHPFDTSVFLSLGSTHGPHLAKREVGVEKGTRGGGDSGPQSAPNSWAKEDQNTRIKKKIQGYKAKAEKE